MTEFEKMISGQLYNSADPELDAFHRICKDKMHDYNQMRSSDAEGRAKAIKNILGSCGQNINIEPPFYIDYGCNIHVGENFYANYGVTLGNNVVVASGAVVTKSFGDNVLLGGVPAKIKRMEK